MEGILQRSFKANFLILQIIGLYPSDTHKRLHKLRGFMTFFGVIFPTAVFCLLRFISERNILSVDNNDIASIGMIFLSGKMFSFLLNSDNLQKCVRKFDATFFVNKENSVFIENCVQICLRNSRVFFIGVGLTEFAWIGTLYFQDDRSHLPFNVWFPYEFEDNPVVFQCAYFTFIFVAVYTGMACAAVDSLIPGLLCQASGQIQSLKKSFQQLDKYINEKLVKTTQKLSRSNVIYVNIRTCVIYYRNILNFVSQYEKCCSAVVFIQFMESIFVIGLCCLQIIKIQSVNVNLAVMIIYLCTFLFQVYFYCYYGTVLLEENNSVPTAIYMSNWYEFSSESKKSLLILMECAKRPLVVSAGKVLDLSLNTFIMILNRSYSLIAVFQNYYQ